MLLDSRTVLVSFPAEWFDEYAALQFAMFARKLPNEILFLSRVIMASGNKMNLSLNIYGPHPKDGGRYCFQFVSPHFRGGGVPHLRSGSGEYPISGLGGGGYPISGLGRGGTPSQVQVRRGTPSQVWGVPHPRSGGVVPRPRSGGILRVPPPRNSRHLLRLRGGRYASCVHAGGLSFVEIFWMLSLFKDYFKI